MSSTPRIVHDPTAPATWQKLYEEIVARLDTFGIDRDNIELDSRGRISLDPEDLVRILELESQTGFRSPYALGRALDTRRQYEHMGILAIQLDLSEHCDTSEPEEVERVLRYLSTHVRELDACYRCLDLTLVMLLPETGSKEEIIGAARRLRTALTAAGVSADIGAAATQYREGAHGHEYMGTALIALVDALSAPERIAFSEV
ncbi:MAG: hypothetical protein AB8B85_20515 [Paracoccaceae bacterium]